MNRRSHWQIWVTALVFVITVSQVLPTIFYYSKPLERNVGTTQAHQISRKLVERAQSLEKETLDWLTAQCLRLKVRPKAIRWNQDNPQFIYLECQKEEDAEILRAVLPSAGASVPFEPGQLRVLNSLPGEDALCVTLTRNVRFHLSPDQIPQALSHIDTSFEQDASYDKLCKSRIDTLKQKMDRDHPIQLQLRKALSSTNFSCAHFALQISSWLQACQDNLELQRRFWTWAVAGDPSPQMTFEQLLGQAQATKSACLQKIESCRQDNLRADKEGQLQDPNALKQLTDLEVQLPALDALISQLKNAENFGKAPENATSANSFFHPLFQDCQWNSADGIATFPVYLDLRESIGDLTDWANTERRPLRQLLNNELGRLASATGESLRLNAEGCDFDLNFGAKSPNWLAFDLALLAQQETSHVVKALKENWKPQIADLQQANYPVLNQANYRESTSLTQQLCLVAVAPCTEPSPFANFKGSGTYLVAKNLGQIQRNAERAGQKTQFQTDVDTLCNLLRSRGYILVQGEEFEDGALKDSLVFELPNFASSYLQATREHFKVLGGQRFALLELGTQGQRLRTVNQIETAMQEDLLQWRDEFRAAQVDLNPQKQLLIPPPPQNALWQNLKLSCRKYWRGDADRSLKWGLDLTGGKCVRIGLRDSAGRPVTGQQELEQTRNELFARVNALGISEVAIRIDGSHLALDFPGSQDISATELVQASSMEFHIVNEKFSTDHPEHGGLVNEFLRGVWNEAQISGKKDTLSLNAIARRHLQETMARGEDGKIASKLKELGLKLAKGDEPPSSALDENVSMIAAYRSDDYRDWYQQNHPLVVVFKNFALEGRDLEDVQARTDANGGHVLTFGIKKRLRNDQTSPRKVFFDWTQQFAKDQIGGNPRELDRSGRGWRMAVMLQSRIVSAPELATALRDQASITGHFSQREIQRLATDLRAGSLSFTPEILSEETIQPQLGQSDRARGITASLAGLAGVVGLMVFAYGFAGAIASVALGFNLLIIWAVLQNLGAALTLPGIAGIVLTMGMAVDANVLIFERMREELQNNSLTKAFQLGYRKALPAIVDSNITTALAAFILIQFDLGPIKGFAITLITGLISSMFTALFATHAFFQAWIQKRKSLDLGKQRTWRKTPLRSLSQFPVALGLSSIILLAGLWTGWQQRHTLLGIDFTGGFTVCLEIQPLKDQSDKLRVEHALTKWGLGFGQYQVRQLQAPHQLRVDLSHSLQAPGGPFADLPSKALLDQNVQYPFERSPRICWMVSTLRQEGVELTRASLEALHSEWSTTSSQFSTALRTRAAVGLGCALLISLLYLAIRFEINYALAAILALTHTLVMTLSAACLLHALKLPIEINLYVIGALMTIIGYCLNDIIIVFDRIREDRRRHARLSWRAVIDQAIQQTLGRTAMTCGTTLIVLFCLIGLGGPNLFGFSSVMALGVLLGTLSSLYIAAPLLLMLEKGSDTSTNLKQSG